MKKMIKKFSFAVVTAFVSPQLFANSAFPGVDGGMTQANSDAIGFIWSLIQKMGVGTLATLMLLTVVSGVFIFKHGMDEYRETNKISRAVGVWLVGGICIAACIGLIGYGGEFLSKFKLSIPST